MPTATTLTARQARFVQEYLVDGNGAGAAVRAGYSEKTARTIACELLTKPDLRVVIRERQAELSVGLKITREGVTRGFLEAYDMAKSDRNPAVMVSAMASLAKLLGYYAVETKRVEVSAAGESTMKRLETMTDAELVGIIEAGTTAPL